jgi:hypothetical protein
VFSLNFHSGSKKMANPFSPLKKLNTVQFAGEKKWSKVKFWHRLFLFFSFLHQLWECSSVSCLHTGMKVRVFLLWVQTHFPYILLILTKKNFEHRENVYLRAFQMSINKIQPFVSELKAVWICNKLKITAHFLI